MEYLLLFGAVMIGLIFKGFYDGKQAKKKLRNRLIESWGKNPTKEYTEEKYRSLGYYYEKHAFCQEKGRFFIDGITWNDLALDELFLTMNHTCSAMGEEVLYALLHEPMLKTKELLAREQLIRFFENPEKKEERLQFQMLLSEIGKHSKISVFEYMSRITSAKRQSNGVHYAALAGYGLGILLLPFSMPAGGILLLLLVIYNVIGYYKRKGEIEPFLAAMSYTIRLLKAAERISDLQIPELSDYLKPIRETVKSFHGFCRGASAVASQNATGDMMSLFLDYFRILFHSDLMKFNRMLREFLERRQELTTVFETIGFLDSMCAAASFRTYYGEYCIPELKEQTKAELCVTGMYHPFVEHPVKADITTTGSVLLTGSNASGKSTFLKEVAVNALLAQTIHTALCTSYRGSCFRILTSIALTDNLFDGESYYIVEIKSLKRILDAMSLEYPTLCFVDEVLRGTNTVERIAASSRVLLSLAEQNAICFAATHDIELTHLLENVYRNYHFEEQISDGRVVFDYKLKEGRATSQNAIWLLAMLGYPGELIASAKKTAEHFTETGEWKLFDRKEEET